ncbi:unnamed protein product [Clonostachys rhizophaga]|uniref:Xylanolytic transcriptional activator regulatory domain-containing protein n=1 Tax=Clonostachys rhizophaga TaxID=160324 RepID=A0A9N9VFC9_9HYPO|nr:unnamed protein product [Clonostachys rhizophaga]
MPGSRPVRRKASEACERCREKRIKARFTAAPPHTHTHTPPEPVTGLEYLTNTPYQCNGLQPCDQCTKKEVQCVFTFAPLTTTSGNEALMEKLDLVLSRLDRLEEEVGRQADALRNNQMQVKQQQYHFRRRSSGVAQLNQQTGCFEYYGQTSTFTIASCLGKRLNQPEDVSNDSPSTNDRREHLIDGHQPPRSKRAKTLDLDELTSFCDYVVPLHSLRSDRYLRGNVTDRHVDNFFRAIHILLPILDPVAFKARYGSLRHLFGDRRLFLMTPDDPTRPQFVCLLFSVLALGALYEDEHEDSSSWASWYFAEAQEMLGRLLMASNIQLVQASTLLGAYAQHAIQPNLAYILNGVAMRLAFSNGLNVESLHCSLGFDIQEARRTWWLVYIQEVELSLDSGRPMTLRSSEMNVKYPNVELPAGGEAVPESAQVMFIPFLAEIAKIMRRIMKLATEPVEPVEPVEQSDFNLEQKEALRHELIRWHASLPNYLAFEDAAQDINNSDASPWLHSWEARQQSSLRIHYYLAIIILLRGSIPRKSPELLALSTHPLYLLHQSCHLNAARNMIRHIYRLFKSAPYLRRWSYYCFYCLQATLVILPKVADDLDLSRYQQQKDACLVPSPLSSTQADREMIEDDVGLCNMAVEVFEKIELKASQRCAIVVRQILDSWEAKQRNDKLDASHTSISVENCGVQRSTSTRVAPEHLADSSSSSSTDTIINEEDSTHISRRSTQAVPNVVDSIRNFGGSSSSSLPTSFSEFEAELYGAFYGILDSGFHVDEQQYCAGSQALENQAMRPVMHERPEESWASASPDIMPPCDNCGRHDPLV